MTPARLIAVSFALPDESGIFLRALHDVHVIRPGNLPVLLGKLGDLEIAVFHTGVGRDSAGIMTGRFLSSHSPSLVISSGFAGGLDPKIRIGGLVLAENFTDPLLLATARLCFDADPAVFFGALTSQLFPAETISEKEHLAATTGAIAVDMETGWIREICQKSNIPLLSLRGISDTAKQSLPVPFSTWFDNQNQKARPFSLVLYLLLHPSAIAPFVRFVRGVFQTKKRIADVLVQVIQMLSKGTCSQE